MVILDANRLRQLHGEMKATERLTGGAVSDYRVPACLTVTAVPVGDSPG
ncbi:MAG: hypothetical protein R3C09_03870 [Pirellulaceae bacterium]